MIPSRFPPTRATWGDASLPMLPLRCPILRRPRLRALVPCRGCLGPIGEGSQAGLCGPCWEGLLPLDGGRCPRCALRHGDPDCPEPCDWDLGEALWDYHGGRPALGALLVPGIKEGELGWKSALLGRLASVPLPPWSAGCDLVTAAPTALPRRLLRGFDLAEEAGALLAGRLDRPFRRTLAKAWHQGRQALRAGGAREVRVLALFRST